MLDRKFSSLQPAGALNENGIEMKFFRDHKPQRPDPEGFRGVMTGIKHIHPPLFCFDETPMRAFSGHKAVDSQIGYFSDFGAGTTRHHRDFAWRVTSAGANPQWPIDCVSDGRLQIISRAIPLSNDGCSKAIFE
jgi:hypothetical protein